MKTLFVSDLDGTLLDADGRLSDRTRAVLRRMEEEGILARLPIDPKVAELCDLGCIEEADPTALASAAEALASK